MRKGSRVKRFLWSGTAAALFAAVTWTNSSSLPASSPVPVKRSDISLTPTAMRSVTSPHHGKSAVPTVKPPIAPSLEPPVSPAPHPTAPSSPVSIDDSQARNGLPLNRRDLARLNIGVREAIAANSGELQQIVLHGPKEVSGQR